MLVSKQNRKVIYEALFKGNFTVPTNDISQRLDTLSRQILMFNLF